MTFGVVDGEAKTPPGSGDSGFTFEWRRTYSSTLSALILMCVPTRKPISSPSRYKS